MLVLVVLGCAHLSWAGSPPHSQQTNPSSSILSKQHMFFSEEEVGRHSILRPQMQKL